VKVAGTLKQEGPIICAEIRPSTCHLAELSKIGHPTNVGLYIGRILKGEKLADLPVSTDQIRHSAHPQDHEGARPHRAAQFARDRRRGHRIGLPIAVVRETGFGPTAAVRGSASGCPQLNASDPAWTRYLFSRACSPQNFSSPVQNDFCNTIWGTPAAIVAG
jgi:hypothetical protein